MVLLLTVCEIFFHIEIENRRFCPLYCRPLTAEEHPAISKAVRCYIAEKHT